MPTLFPTAKDDNTTLPNPGATDKTNSPSHASQHDNANDAIKAIEAKVGTGNSAPAAATLLMGTGPGTSAWSQLTSAQLASVLSDETGSGSAVFGNTPTLITPKVDTINESTLNNGVTVAGLNIKAGVLSTSNSVPTTALQDASVTSQKVATGMSVNQIVTTYSVVATGTTVIPYDDTIPQITEGDEYMTQAITPKSATNRLLIEANLYISNSVAQDFTVALFQDATANALNAIGMLMLTATGVMNIRLTHDMLAGTTSSTTFRIRAGGVNAGTTTFNGAAAARKLGAIPKSSIKVTEYKG